MTASNELNFLPEDYLEQKTNRRAHWLCAVLVALNAGGIYFAWSTVSHRHADAQSRYADVNARYVDAARKIEQVKSMHDKQRDVMRHAELAASLVEKVPRSNLLAEITNSLPAGVSLLELAMDSKPHQEPAPAASSSFAQHKAAIVSQQKEASAAAQVPRLDVTLKVTGIARDDVQVAQLISRLNHSPLFQDVNLVVTEKFQEGAANDKQNTEPLRRWQLELTLNPKAEIREPSRTAAVEVGNEGLVRD